MNGGLFNLRNLAGYGLNKYYNCSTSETSVMKKCIYFYFLCILDNAIEKFSINGFAIC